MKTIYHIAVLVVGIVFPAVSGAVAAERAPNYKVALERAKATKADIVVFQRGSDWSHFGELLHADVWNQAAFLKEAGDNIILVVVDNPENPGAPPTGKHAPEDAQPIYNKKLCAAELLRDFVDEKQPVPPNEITAIRCANGSVYKRRRDGAFLVAGKTIPNQEVLTLTIRPANDGNLLRIDFPLDDSLPGQGPGRPDNGNFAITELEVEGVKTVGAFSSRHEGNFGAWLITLFPIHAGKRANRAPCLVSTTIASSLCSPGGPNLGPL